VHITCNLHRERQFAHAKRPSTSRRSVLLAHA
jgi:hypothetical protein